MLFVERGIISPKNHVQRMAINEFCSENAKTMNFDLKGIKKRKSDWFSAQWQVLKVSITQYLPNLTTTYIFFSRNLKKLSSPRDVSTFTM